tara:strand:+ start:101 stop:3436 length:3336 start_codon:yes stop_codon:yes gene_type:complete
MYVHWHLISITVSMSILSATWFDEIPRIIRQPDGEILECFISGDQYLRRLHDVNNFTIVHHKEDGFFYYAQKDSYGSLIPSTIIAGRGNPQSIGLQPGYSLSEEDYNRKKQSYHQEELIRNNRDAPNTGEINQINVFIRFADDPEFPDDRSTYGEIFETDYDEPSLKHYFSEISHDRLTINTLHFPGSLDGSNTSYVDSHERSYYQPYSAANSNGYQSQSDRFLREHSLVANALNSISQSVSSSVDLDLDDNGFVDAVSIVVYGTQGAWADLLWPHRTALFNEEVYINGAQVYDYLFMLSESWYYNVGVLCHEFGHVLGAPDYYHYSAGNGPTPVGYWDVMGSVRNPPQYPSAFTKWKYFNWIEPIEITSSGTYSLMPLQEEGNSSFLVSSPFSEEEYFIFEYRNQEGMYDSNAPGTRSGLVAYRINEGAGNGNASGPPDELYVYRPQGDINSTGNLNDAPYSVTYGHAELNDYSDPSCFLYNGGEGGMGGLQLLDVTEPTDSISFTIITGTPELQLSQSSFDYALEVGNYNVKTLTISNNGEPGSLLDYEVSKPDSTDWLILSSDNGSLDGVLESGDLARIHLQVYAMELGEGDYAASFNIFSGDTIAQIIDVNLMIDGGELPPVLPRYDISSSETGIINLPNDTDPIFLNVANRYTHVVAENGDFIPILIQDNYTVDQITHVRKVLESFLVDIPNSDWGSNKAMISNAIGATNAILLLLDDEDEYENPDVWSLMDSGARGQDLLSTEVFPEGSVEYMNSSRRNATYEEVLHFIHNYGIQVANPTMQNEILSAMELAVESGYYNPLSDLPTEDWDEEYLAMGLECYFGIWSHDPSGNGFCGDQEYPFIDRAAMLDNDPALHNIINGFFGSHWNYQAQLPDNFTGNFHLSLQPSLDYTYRSQYIVNIKLTGSNNVSIYGNEFDNQVIGNAGSNLFYGYQGDDNFRGLGGQNRAIFSGGITEYDIVQSVENSETIVRVIDFESNRDGTDLYLDVEEFDFNGTVYQVSDLLEYRPLGSNVPTLFELHEPFPNPFNPKTKIALNTTNDAKIELVIFDINGRLVREFDISGRSPGYHVVEWDASDNYGNQVSTGVYFIRFTSEASYQVQKIVFLK